MEVRIIEDRLSENPRYIKEHTTCALLWIASLTLQTPSSLEWFVLSKLKIPNTFFHVCCYGQTWIPDLYVSIIYQFPVIYLLHMFRACTSLNFLGVQSVGNRVGVQEPFLMRMAHGAPVRTSNRSRDSTKGFQGRSEPRHGVLSHDMLSNEQSLRVCKRFYVALILSRLVQVIFFQF